MSRSGDDTSHAVAGDGVTMTPHEMDKIRTQFNEAARKLGWSCRDVEIGHERDNTKWVERMWHSRSGGALFSENDLYDGLGLEIIRLASLQ